MSLCQVRTSCRLGESTSAQCFPLVYAPTALRENPVDDLLISPWRAADEFRTRYPTWQQAVGFNFQRRFNG